MSTSILVFCEPVLFCRASISDSCSNSFHHDTTSSHLAEIILHGCANHAYEYDGDGVGREEGSEEDEEEQEV